MWLGFKHRVESRGLMRGTTSDKSRPRGDVQLSGCTYMFRVICQKGVLLASRSPVSLWQFVNVSCQLLFSFLQIAPSQQTLVALPILGTHLYVFLVSFAA